jgi:hypothetical protein
VRIFEQAAQNMNFIASIYPATRPNSAIFMRCQDKVLFHPKRQGIFDAGQGAETKRPFGIRLRREMQRYAE